ncbi:hypothetical protein LEMLEM_LOCUS5167 [Lemmus lemmus]
MAKPLQSQRLSESLRQEGHMFQLMRGGIRKICKEEKRGKWRMAKPVWLESHVWNEVVKTRQRICVSVEMIHTKGLVGETSLRRPEKIVSRTQRAG